MRTQKSGNSLDSPHPAQSTLVADSTRSKLVGLPSKYSTRVITLFTFSTCATDACGVCAQIVLLAESPLRVKSAAPSDSHRDAHDDP